jgi:hypothetical protein
MIAHVGSARARGAFALRGGAALGVALAAFHAAVRAYFS